MFKQIFLLPKYNFQILKFYVIGTIELLKSMQVRQFKWKVLFENFSREFSNSSFKSDRFRLAYIISKYFHLH